MKLKYDFDIMELEGGRVAVNVGDEEYGSAVWLDRVQLEVRSELAGNDANVWKGYARFTGGFNDWRGYAVGGVSGGTQLVTD